MPMSAARTMPPPTARSRLKMCSCEGRSPALVLGPRFRGGDGPLVHRLHDQRGVGAAEAEAVVEHRPHRPLLCLVRNEIDALAAFAWIIEVERRRDNLVAHREDAENALDR